jgi:hypothetical protein
LKNKKQHLSKTCHIFGILMEQKPAWQRMYPNVAEAVDWLKAHATQLTGRHRLPDVVAIEEHELQQLAEDPENEDLRDAQVFWFEKREDVFWFIEELRTKKDLLVHAGVDEMVRYSWFLLS